MIDARYRVQYPEGAFFGITHFLAGKCEIEDVFYATEYKRAFFVPVGYAVSNSLALLNSVRFGNLLEQLAPQVDYILIDAPPVGLIVDALEIAKSCDGALLAVGYNAVRRRELVDARLQIERAPRSRRLPTHVVSTSGRGRAAVLDPAHLPPRTFTHARHLGCQCRREHA